MEYNKPELRIIITEKVFTELVSLPLGGGEELQDANKLPQS